MGRKALPAKLLRNKVSFMLERVNRDRAAQVAKRSGMSLPRWIEMVVKKALVGH